MARGAFFFVFLRRLSQLIWVRFYLQFISFGNPLDTALIHNKPVILLGAGWWEEASGSRRKAGVRVKLRM